LIPNLLIAPSRVERESGADRDDAHRERVFEILRFAHPIAWPWSSSF